MIKSFYYSLCTNLTRGKCSDVKVLSKILKLKIQVIEDRSERKIKDFVPQVLLLSGMNRLSRLLEIKFCHVLFNVSLRLWCETLGPCVPTLVITIVTCVRMGQKAAVTLVLVFSPPPPPTTFGDRNK